MQTGQLGPSNPPAVTPQLPRVTVGGVAAQVQFSGYAPGFLGLYQINAVIPTTAPVGSSVELSVVLGNPTFSKNSRIAVQ